MCVSVGRVVEITLLNSDPNSDRIITNACWDIIRRHYPKLPAEEEYPWPVMASWWMDDFNARLHNCNIEEQGVSFNNEQDYLMFLLKFDTPCRIAR